MFPRKIIFFRKFQKKLFSESMYYGIKSAIIPTSPYSFSNGRQYLALKLHMREAIGIAISKNIFSKKFSKTFSEKISFKKTFKNFQKIISRNINKIQWKTFQTFFCNFFKINVFDQKTFFFKINFWVIFNILVASSRWILIQRTHFS